MSPKATERGAELAAAKPLTEGEKRILVYIAEFAPLFVEFAPLSKNARTARKPRYFRPFPAADDTKA